jgi:hypothetical protein
MGGVSFKMVRVILYPTNAPFPITVNEAGSVMLLKAVQLRNASLPIAVTVAGSVTLFKAVQSLNALSGITVIDAGSVTLVRRLPDNIVPMFVTVEGTAYVVLPGGKTIIVCPLLLSKTPSTLE